MRKWCCFIAAVMLLCAVFMVVACGKETVGLRINVPSETQQAELGSYDLPKYEVVDEDGLIMAGYMVTVKSVKGPDGEDVKVVYSKINVSKAGIYEITYTAGDGIPDAVLKVDFADRTAPTVEMDEDSLPKFYIDGFTYDLPVYSIVNGPDLSKCWIKVYYLENEQSERTEVKVENSRFKVEHNSGTYIIVIHAEDAIGNSQNYEYAIEAIGPSEIVDGKILYFDEQFGISQVKTLWNNFKISYSTEKAYDNEAGSTKVVGNGGTDYIILDRLIESDVSNYTHLVIRIFNANDFEVYAGYCWFADLTLEPNAWTELKIPVSDLDTQNVTHPSIGGVKISSENITNLSLRLFDDYNTNQLPSGATFYLSAMYAVTEEPKTPDQVVEDKIVYFDEEFGLSQVSLYWPAEYKISYDTTVHFGEELGSCKVNIVKPQNDYIIVNNPYIKDVSEYDYLVFYVFNAADTSFSMGTTWTADTVIVPGEWTKVKIPIDKFDGTIVNMNSEVLSASDISKLPIRIFAADNMSAGDNFYISAMYGEKTELQPGAENVILDFDQETCMDRVSVYWPDGIRIAYDTEQKFEEQTGSLKVEFLKAQDNYIILDTPCIQDVSEYDYLVFHVFNSSETSFSIGTTWTADTVIVPGEWTKVKIPVNKFNGTIVNMDSEALSAGNISAMPIRIFLADNVTVGDCFYISAMYGDKVEQVPGRENVVLDFDEETCMDRVSPFWSDAIAISYDTEQKFEDQAGSLKVEFLKTQDNYIILDTPCIQDVSAYEYLVFHVYNPTDTSFSMGTTWAADTEIAPNGWTEVRIDISLFDENKISDMDENKLAATNITKFPIRIFNATGMSVGDCFYISAMHGQLSA